MDPPTALLSMLGVAFIHLVFAMAMLQYGPEPLCVLLYFIAVAFFGALYFRRRLGLRRHQRGGLYHGLGYVAVVLGALLSALFFCSVDPGMPMSLAIAVWLGLAIAAYFFYRVIVIHLEDAAVQGQVGMRAPV